MGTALVILAEIGVDVSRFPTEKHFASWLGVCPRQHESNRTKKKRGPRKGKNRVAIALRMAAQAVGRTQSPLGLFYRRIKSRIGGQGAVTATAHKLACLVYRMLKYGTEYVKRSHGRSTKKRSAANWNGRYDAKPPPWGINSSHACRPPPSRRWQLPPLDPLLAAAAQRLAPDCRKPNTAIPAQQSDGGKGEV